MKRLMLAVLLCGTAALTAAQDRSAELDQAYEEARAACVALKEAEARRDQGIEPQLERSEVGSIYLAHRGSKAAE